MLRGTAPNGSRLAQRESLVAQQVQQCREQYRRSRAELAVPLIALVGYTNAGKSCLMNALTSAGVFSEDALFATLDTTVRKIALPSGLQASVFSYHMRPSQAAVHRKTVVFQ